MRKIDHPAENRDESSIHTRDLSSHERVLFAQQLFSKTRVKRGYKSEDILDLKKRELIRMRLAKLREIRNNEEIVRGIPPELLQFWDNEYAKYDDEQSVPVQKEKPLFNDPLWDHEWYLHDTRTSSDLPELDLHWLEAVKAGYTGKGVRVCVLDDGLEWTHQDLRDNYDAEISYDYNSGDTDPTPRYPDPTDEFGVPNSHGTRCAGEIAMKANNGQCGVGVAFNAKIGGVRMLDGKINDEIEGKSLQHAYEKVDIFTASWGPSDDGKTVEGPGHLARVALEKGITKGRNGKGIIYVWASGNGGSKGDNCNCDGYVSHPYTISIGSASENGEFPWYGEKCASTMAVTYSSGAYTDQKIATTDTNNTCTVSHTGTSAAAPLGAGLIALALEANPDLTWRDVQHLIVFTSDPKQLEKNPGWEINGAGIRYNSRFGFGMMNAEKLVNAAKNWQTVPKRETQEFQGAKNAGTKLESGESVLVEFSVEESASKIFYVEHAQVTVNIDYPVRGALEVVLESPAGTMSQLLTARPEDTSTKGFQDWTFTSVHFWSENPAGNWKLHIVDQTPAEEPRSGVVGEVKLILHGTKDPPVSENELRRDPRIGDNLNWLLAEGQTKR